MLKTCSYCRKIHQASYICNARKEADKKRWKSVKKTGARQFRSTSAWTATSKAIRRRDRGLCLCCLAMLPGTVHQYNPTKIQVHHIVPLDEDMSLRLDQSNLISVCDMHHEMCEAGAITRDAQRQLAAEAIKMFNSV